MLWCCGWWSDKTIFRVNNCLSSTLKREGAHDKLRRKATKTAKYRAIRSALLSSIEGGGLHRSKTRSRGRVLNASGNGGSSGSLSLRELIPSSFCRTRSHYSGPEHKEYSPGPVIFAVPKILREGA